jgi:hypothetical protein
VRNALDELGIDYGFVPVVDDVELPDDHVVPMPAGAYNLKQAFVYNGTPTDIGYMEKVYYKKGGLTAGYDTGYTANVKPYMYMDPYCQVDVSDYSLYFFTINNGNIYLSDACSGFDYVRFVYDGLPSRNLSDVRMVPVEVRKAVVDWTTARCAGALKMRDARYRVFRLC